jgi:hypothetical protein
MPNRAHWQSVGSRARRQVATSMTGARSYRALLAYDSVAGDGGRTSKSRQIRVAWAQRGYPMPRHWVSAPWRWAWPRKPQPHQRRIRVTAMVGLIAYPWHHPSWVMAPSLMNAG